VSASPCGTRKYVFATHDGFSVETVAIPNPSRTTLCVSSQVGCARRCGFCVTGAMGLRRSLSAAEILAQVPDLEGLAPLRNIVFMGMGEPLDNARAVRAAIDGFIARGIAPRHITVSTIGPSPERLREACSWPGRLAWSLHSARADVRRRLVPGSHNLEALRAAIVGEVFVEVVLLDGINDSDADARHLAQFLAPLQARVNLLPMNPWDTPYRASPRAQAFKQVVMDAGYFCSVRRARGDVAMAACGQLGRAAA
jgi:23S rRNA (adenine2503-C2)-methyltransferase